MHFMHLFNVCFALASCLMILFGEKVLKSVREQIFIPTKTLGQNYGNIAEMLNVERIKNF